MRPFRFPLRKVREHRERVKRERQAALARIESELQELRLREAALSRERMLRIQHRNDARAAAVTPSEEALFAAYLAHLDVETGLLAATIAGCEARRDKAREAFTSAAIELRAMEKLEERRRREHELDEARDETRELDEVGRDSGRRSGH